MTSRERELLELLEVIRRNNESLTIADFARRAGYSNKTALRHFPTLRRALHEYCDAVPSRVQKRRG
jgi:predicted DNA-binding transcriptional regulator YafY